MWLYFIIGTLLVLLICSFVKTVIVKTEPTNWQLISLGTAFLFLLIITAVDIGWLDKLKLTAGDQEYSVSTQDFENYIGKNINKLGLAIAKVYEKYYHSEVFNISEDSDRVKIEEKDGSVYLKVKLSHKPVVSTIEVDLIGGQYFFGTGYEPHVDDDLNMWLKWKEKYTKEEFLNFTNIDDTLYVKYFIDKN